MGRHPTQSAQTVPAAHAHILDDCDVTLQKAPQAPYNRDHALRFPLSIHSHDIGFRYLFDFMVVATSLALRPGAEVLDFAAGSCYISELLNRLGYRTVAFDRSVGSVSRWTRDATLTAPGSWWATAPACRFPMRALTELSA
jgi:2-polyprenyl-3-methyl-5-hydroxy-6-metoxy-1,4-benzoquinol methylase